MPEIADIDPQALITSLIEDGLLDEPSAAHLLGPARHDVTLPELEVRLLDRMVISNERLLALKGSLTGLPVLDDPTVEVRPILPQDAARLAGALVLDLPTPAVAFVEPIADNIRIVQQVMSQAEFDVWLITTPQFKSLLRSAYSDTKHVELPEVTDIHEVFNEMIDSNASDTHVKVGKPPMLRIDGTLRPTKHRPVSQQWMRDNLTTLVGKEGVAALEADTTVDQAYGYGTARFRLNCGVDQDGFTLVARQLATSIPSMDDLSLPQAVRKFTELERGLVLVTGPTGSGKPVAGSTVVLCGDGSRRAIKDLKVGDTVITHKGHARAVIDVLAQGSLPVLRITTRNGRSVLAAADHPFLTSTGFTTADSLVPGDTLVNVARPSCAPTTELPDEEFRLAGYVLATLPLTSFPASLVFTDLITAKDARRCAESLGLIPESDSSGPSTLMVSPQLRRWALDRGLAIEAARSLVSHGRLPDFLFTAANSQVAQFMGTYLTACLPSTFTVSPTLVKVTSTSRGLLADIQHLLLRFAVQSRVRCTADNPGCTSWSLTITLPEALARFSAQVYAFDVPAYPALASVADEQFLADEIVEVCAAGVEDCYCITVDDDATYTVQDVVCHNSTTLASMLAHIIKHQSRHVITLEDPIEYQLPDGATSVVNQRELGTDFRTFPSALRQALRQDPDVILVGEMRDAETVRTATQAAETGHLVFSTLHTIDAQSSVARLVSFFPEGEQEHARQVVAYILRGVVSQTLVPRSSTSGRIAAMEVLVGTPAISNNLRKSEGLSMIRSTLQTGRKDGMQTMEMALASLVRRGTVSQQEAEFRARDLAEFERNLAAGQ